MKNPQTAALVDAYSQIYRGFYAIPQLTNAQGEPTNALYAIARFTMWFERDYTAEYAAFVMDKGAPKKRLELHPEYKATRPPMPDALRSQIEPIRQWVEAAGWTVLEKENTEADDLIAAVVTECENCQVYIISQDKDLGQLVSDRVTQLIPGKKGKLDAVTPRDVQEKFGLPPSAIRDYIALTGDTVDNIPGVPGIGPKTAQKLLQQFGSLSGMLAATDRITPETLREKVRSAAEDILRNRELVSLDPELPPQWTGLDMIAKRPPQWDRMIHIARDNNFKSLVTAVEKARNDFQNPVLF